MRIESHPLNYLAQPHDETLSLRRPLVNRLIEADRLRQIIDPCDCVPARENEEAVIVEHIELPEIKPSELPELAQADTMTDEQFVTQQVEIPIPYVGNLLDVYA